MEEKNYSLLIECQKHTEASRMSEKLISELETENPEQRVEAEFLLDKIEKLRKGTIKHSLDKQGKPLTRVFLET